MSGGAYKVQYFKHGKWFNYNTVPYKTYEAAKAQAEEINAVHHVPTRVEEAQ